jgi:AcrR family transcriptional regulator
MKSTTTPKRMTREDRRAFLLDAAVRVLHHHPLADLSFELVADEAGVSKTLPYSYFESPAEIAIALFDRVVGGVDAASEALVATEFDFDEKVRGSLHLWCDMIAADGGLVLSLLNGRAVSAIRPLLDARDTRAEAMWSNAIAAEFDVAKADAEFLGAVVTASATAALYQWSARRLDRDEVLDRLLRSVRAMGNELARS